MSSDFQSLFRTNVLVLDSYSHMKVVLKLTSPFLVPSLVSSDTFKGKFTWIQNRKEKAHCFIQLFLSSLTVTEKFFVTQHKEIKM